MPPWQEDFWFTSHKTLLRDDCTGLPPGYQLLQQHTGKLFANVTNPSAFYCICSKVRAVNIMLLSRFSGLIWYYMLNIWPKFIEGHFETDSETLWTTTCTTFFKESTGENRIICTDWWFLMTCLALFCSTEEALLDSHGYYHLFWGCALIRTKIIYSSHF